MFRWLKKIIWLSQTNQYFGESWSAFAIFFCEPQSCFIWEKRASIFLSAYSHVNNDPFLKNDIFYWINIIFQNSFPYYSSVETHKYCSDRKINFRKIISSGKSINKWKRRESSYFLILFQEKPFLFLFGQVFPKILKFEKWNMD